MLGLGIRPDSDRLGANVQERRGGSASIIRTRERVDPRLPSTVVGNPGTWGGRKRMKPLLGMTVVDFSREHSRFVTAAACVTSSRPFVKGREPHRFPSAEGPALGRFLLGFLCIRDLVATLTTHGVTRGDIHSRIQ